MTAKAQYSIDPNIGEHSDFFVTLMCNRNWPEPEKEFVTWNQVKHYRIGQKLLLCVGRNDVV